MKKEDNMYYNKCNTSLITHMCNLMQFVYGDEHVRGKFDEVVVNEEVKKIAPLFSAFQAFIITTALTMRQPGQEKISSNISNEQMFKNIDNVIRSIESILSQPIRGNLISSIEVFLTNGKFEQKPIKDEEAEMLFRKKAH